MLRRSVIAKARTSWRDGPYAGTAPSTMRGAWISLPAVYGAALGPEAKLLLDGLPSNKVVLLLLTTVGYRAVCNSNPLSHPSISDGAGSAHYRSPT